MAHLHQMYDTDQHFTIDPLTMEIHTDADIKPLRKGEHLAEIKTFEMPRYLDGHDMLLCNKVEVHYNNINVNTATRTTTEVKSFDKIEDFAIAPEDENTVIWSWHIAGDAAQNSGNTSFCFRFACLENDVITYQKFTEIYAAIPVNDTIYNTEQLAQEHVDALERWKLEIVEECAGAVPEDKIIEAVNNYLDENPVETGVQFETDDSLSLEDGVLSVRCADAAEPDNTLPITSAAVAASIGNIEVLLSTI